MLTSREMPLFHQTIHASDRHQCSAQFSLLLHRELDIRMSVSTADAFTTEQPRLSLAAVVMDELGGTFSQCLMLGQSMRVCPLAVASFEGGCRCQTVYQSVTSSGPEHPRPDNGRTLIRQFRPRISEVRPHEHIGLEVADIAPVCPTVQSEEDRHTD